MFYVPLLLVGQIEENILIPTITNKRYKKREFSENIWFDITWDTNNLKKKTRAVKGVLIFADLFGEPKFMINPLTPKKIYISDTVGFAYNQFIDSHKWMLSSDIKDIKDIKDITFKFKIKNIIYADGSRENF